MRMFGATSVAARGCALRPEKYGVYVANKEGPIGQPLSGEDRINSERLLDPSGRTEGHPMRDDEHQEIRLRASDTGDLPKTKWDMRLRPGENVGILAVFGVQLGIDTALTGLACFWRDPFLNVLIFYGLGSFALCVCIFGRGRHGEGVKVETGSIGFWVGLWGLMGV